MIAEQPTHLVQYDVTEAQIAATRAKCADMTAGTPQGYEEVRMAIGHLRDTRGAIERRRVELKADALAYGRLVDGEAQRFTALLMEIEDPLKVKKAAVDDEKARLKAEAELVKVRALETEIRANQERQEAERKALRDAEEARIAAERAQLDAERQALAEERAVVEAAQRVERATLAEDRRLEEERQRAARKAEEDRQRVEREAIEAQRRAVDAAREQAERIEFERQAKIQAEADAVKKAEQDRLAAAERQARLDALRPDLEKVLAFAATILALVSPKPRTKEAKAMIATAVESLEAVAVTLTAAAKRVG